jgi:hypothetical protein
MIDIMQLEVIGPAIRHGIKLGIPQGIRSVLRRQLTLRFGPLPDHVVALLDEATEDELLGCVERVLTADTLYEVLAPAISQTFERGVKEGIRRTISLLLTMKFRGLPEHAVDRLDRATKDELLDYSERALTAATLDEVFR